MTNPDAVAKFARPGNPFVDEEPLDKVADAEPLRDALFNPPKPPAGVHLPFVGCEIATVLALTGRPIKVEDDVLDEVGVPIALIHTP